MLSKTIRAIIEMISGLMVLGPATLAFFLTQEVFPNFPAHVPRPAASEAPSGDQHTASPSGSIVAPNQIQNTSADLPISVLPPCDKPDALGISRLVQIDPTGGPEFGLQHLKGYDFLGDKEVVLTFDDGPWPGGTEAVLKALTDECLRATFFEIGEHATWHPDITRQVIQAGMTVGTHTWSHKDLARKLYARDSEKAKEEIEMGNSAVRHAAGGGDIAPFFRFPDLQHSQQLLSYLAERNIAIFSTDIDSRDFTMHKPEQVVSSVMNQLEKRGKGIVLLHDFHRNTGEAMPELLQKLKAAGYKIVHMVPKVQLVTIAKYDERFKHQGELSYNNTPSENKVVRKVGERAEQRD